MDYLVIRLHTDETVEWIVVDDQGARKSNVKRGSLADAAGGLLGKSVILMVPSADVTTVTTDLPLRGNRLIAALPYALEDHVADEVDNLHFAPGKRRADGTLPVAVVSRAAMDAWLEQLETVGIRPQRIVAEYHGVASVPNTLSMIVAGREILFNDGRGLCFALPDASPADVIAASGYLDPVDDSGEAAGSSRALQVYCEPGADERFERDWALLRNELDSVDVRVLPDGAFPRLAVTAASGAGINLLQGAYGERKEYGSMLSPWRYAAFLLLGVMLLSIAGKFADYVRLGVEEEALRAQFTEQYRAFRPGDNREILDPVATVDSVRRSMNAGPAAAPVFLPSLSTLAAAIQSNRDVEIEAISYRAGVIDVRLTAPDVATLDKIQQAVSASSRFTATIQSTTQSAAGLDSRIQIRESGA